MEPNVSGKLVIAMTNYELLQHANKHGDIVVISTEWSTYEDCQIIWLNNEEIMFNAIHPLKGGEYEFQFHISSITTVENITNNEQMWFQQTTKENSNE